MNISYSGVKARITGYDPFYHLLRITWGGGSLLSHPNNRAIRSGLTQVDYTVQINQLPEINYADFPNDPLNPYKNKPYDISQDKVDFDC